MTIGGGEAADQMVRMMLSSGEVAVRLTGSAMKNLLALTMALARDNKTISGKVNLGKMLKETRDLRLFPMSPEQYKEFQKHAKKQKILFSAIKDRDGKGEVIDVVLPVTELDRANLVFERMMYQGYDKQAPDREKKPVSRPEKGAPERSQARDRQPPQRGQECLQKEHDPQANNQHQEDAPPKKDSRSGRDSLDTKTRSSTSRESERTMTSSRPSVEGRLRDYRAELDNRQKSAPTRSKSRAPKVSKDR